MAISYKSTHVSEAIGNLITYFRDKPNWMAFVTALCGEIQTIEDVLWDMYNALDIDQAEGDQLDNLGVKAGEPRYGRGDDDYRLAIRVRIAVNISRGTPEDIMNVLHLITEDKSIRITDKFPAGYYATILDALDPTDDPSEWIGYVQDATGAGIEAVLVAHVDPVFMWDYVYYEDGDGIWGTGSWGIGTWGGVSFLEDGNEHGWDVGLWNGMWSV